MKTASLALAVSLLAIQAWGITTIHWFSDSIATQTDGPDIVDRLDSPVSDTSGWLIQLYTTTDATMDLFTDLRVDGAVEDAFSSERVGVMNEWPFYDVGPSGLNLGGQDVFTVIFDSQTLDGAEWYCILDANPYSIPVLMGDGDPEFLDYNVGVNVAGDWKPIPEPGTLALLGAGLTAVLGWRMVRSRHNRHPHPNPLPSRADLYPQIVLDTARRAV